MKRVGYITDKDGRRITLLAAMGDYGNVQKAYNKARKCKRHRKDVLIFTKDKEENLDKVREDILNLAYEPSEYHYFKVYEPKERQIMALPFYDRVVQHAINNVLEPIGAESRRCLIMQNRRAYPLQTLICSWAFYGKNCRDTQQ